MTVADVPFCAPNLNPQDDVSSNFAIVPPSVPLPHRPSPFARVLAISPTSPWQIASNSPRGRRGWTMIVSTTGRISYSQC